MTVCMYTVLNLIAILLHPVLRKWVFENIAVRSDCIHLPIRVIQVSADPIQAFGVWFGVEYFHHIHHAHGSRQYGGWDYPGIYSAVSH